MGFQDIHMKKEILIQKIKKLRGDAKKAGKNITETVQTRNSDGAVHEKVFTFLADGTVHLEDKANPSGRSFGLDEEIDAEVFDTIFPQDLIENFNVEGEEDWKDTTSGVETHDLTQSVLMCVLVMVVVSV